MAHAPQDDYPVSDAQSRADELRSLAGPVESGAERPADDGPDGTPLEGDAPDARTDPAVDEGREGGEGDLGDDADPYAGRSMPAEPNPTADDPASDLNF
ncbi:hypothetical protein [Actinotalea solisilvae]|uniref:hypothetical protein n=1 Tax=Actinotalea solisilvae TaxID=2072922 RepID=UPI0018F21E51|nr:hypothetical protein [Actinotalea solisilvae]